MSGPKKDGPNYTLIVLVFVVGLTFASMVMISRSGFHVKHGDTEVTLTTSSDKP